MPTSYKAILTGKKQLVDRTYLFTFKIIEPDGFSFVAGQYLMLKVPKEHGFVWRLYSIASPPSQNQAFELIIELIPNGLGSTYVDGLSISQQVEFMGPAGLFVLKDPARKRIFLVTGTGIAPVVSMLKGGMENYELYWGIKSYKEVFMLDELKRFNPKICLSRENDLSAIPEADRIFFDKGHVDELFEKNLGEKNVLDMEFYLCGGREIVESLRLFLLGKNVPRENIHFEKF